MKSFYIKVNNKMERLDTIYWFGYLKTKLSSGVRVNALKEKKIKYILYNAKFNCIDTDLNTKMAFIINENQLSITDFLDCETIEQACKKAGGGE